MKKTIAMSFWTAISLLAAALPAAAQFSPMHVTSIPVGPAPMGIGTFVDGVHNGVVMVVALSGSDTVLVAAVAHNIATGQATGLGFTQTFPVPKPFAVEPCSGSVLVTSPSDGSITLAGVDTSNPSDPRVTSVTTLKLGASPYAVACYDDGYTSAAVVSTTDDALLVLDLGATLTVRTRIANVPASKSLHGILSRGNTAWVASTDKNLITIVDINQGKVLGQIPVAGPLGVGFQQGSVAGTVVASPTQSSVFLVSSALQVLATVPNVPSPQDIQDSGSPLTGQFVTTGTGNSVIQLSTDNPSARTVFSGIPNAFGLALGIFQKDANPVAFALVTSPSANAVYVIQEPPAPPLAIPLKNAASFVAQGAAPGSLTTVFVNTGATLGASANSVPLPTTLAGTSVQIGGSFSYDDASGSWQFSSQGATPASLLFANGSQINLQIPPGTPISDATPIQIQTTSGPVSGTIKVAAVSPGIFTIASTGTGQGAVLNQDYSANFGTNPAARGSVIQIFATGAGATNPSLAAGTPAPASGSPLVFTQVQPAVSIGGLNAVVQFSGMAPGFVGVWQINAVVPQSVTPGSTVPLSVAAAGVQSNIVTIAVK
jgi:uncharacterized protein (TIGR03437 family)